MKRPAVRVAPAVRLDISLTKCKIVKPCQINAYHRFLPLSLWSSICSSRGNVLVSSSSRRPSGALKRGSVYVTLGRMEAKGFVQSRQEARQPGAIGLPRRLYVATPYGLKVRDAYRLLREALAFKPAEAQ